MAPTNGKKVKKNGFVIFVEERMAALKREGEASFPNGLQDAIRMMAPEWEALSAETKAQYKEAATKTRQQVSRFQSLTPSREAQNAAKDTKQKTQEFEDDAKKTTFGFTIGQIRDIQRTKLLQKYQRRIQCKAVCDFKKDPCKKQIILIKFTPYCFNDNGEYIPAEVGMVAFSLQDGIIDNYSALIDPGEPPGGSRFQFMRRSKENGLPMPPFSEYCRDYRRILKEMQTYIDAHPPCLEGKRILFCTRPDTATNESCLKWLYKACGVPEPEGTDKYALRPIGLLFLHMFRNGAEFHDRLKEVELLLPPEAVAHSLSQEVIYKCGVPYFNIDDGRTRSRRLTVFDRVQIYDSEDEPAQLNPCDRYDPNDLLAITELARAQNPECKNRRRRERRAGPRNENPQPLTALETKLRLKEEGWKRDESSNTKSKRTSAGKGIFQTIPEEEEGDGDPTSQVEQLQEPVDMPDSTEYQENFNEVLSEAEESLYFVKRSHQSGGGTRFEEPGATHKMRQFIQSLGQANVASIPKTDVDEIHRLVGLSKLSVDIESSYPKSQTCNVVAEIENEVENDSEHSEEENNDPQPGPSKLSQQDFSTIADIIRKLPRGGSQRAAIWSQPLRARRPGEPEKYGDADPLLAILWEGDAMEYLRTLDCAYIAEICCPHHTANNEIWESCPLNLLNRIALNFLDVQLGFWNIKPIEGKHYPYRDVALEGQKRMDWSKRVFGHKQYGYKDIAGFKDSGEFKRDDEDKGAEEPEPDGTDENDFSGVFYVTNSSESNEDEPDEPPYAPATNTAGVDEKGEFVYFS